MQKQGLVCERVNITECWKKKHAKKSEKQNLFENSSTVIYLAMDILIKICQDS